MTIDEVKKLGFGHRVILTEPNGYRCISVVVVDYVEIHDNIVRIADMVDGCVHVVSPQDVHLPQHCRSFTGMECTQNEMPKE